MAAHLQRRKGAVDFGAMFSIIGKGIMTVSITITPLTIAEVL